MKVGTTDVGDADPGADHLVRATEPNHERLGDLAAAELGLQLAGDPPRTIRVARQPKLPVLVSSHSEPAAELTSSDPPSGFTPADQSMALAARRRRRRAAPRRRRLRRRRGRLPHRREPGRDARRAPAAVRTRRISLPGGLGLRRVGVRFFPLPKAFDADSGGGTMRRALSVIVRAPARRWGGGVLGHLVGSRRRRRIRARCRRAHAVQGSPNPGLGERKEAP
jgi:hypothetical protein